MWLIERVGEHPEPGGHVGIWCLAGSIELASDRRYAAGMPSRTLHPRLWQRLLHQPRRQADQPRFRVAAVAAQCQGSDRHPALLLTALGTTADKTYGLDIGADDYLVKPFALEELLARIRALLRRPPTVAQSILKIGDLELDTHAKSISRQGKLIELTAKEYALLEYLMRHPGQTITKETLIAHVWDFDADILPNNVEAHIKQLRRKIDKPFGSSLIQTVRGLGYRMGS